MHCNGATNALGVARFGLPAGYGDAVELATERVGSVPKRTRSFGFLAGVAGAISAAAITAPAFAQRLADPLTLREPVSRPFERALAWRAGRFAADPGGDQAGRPALLLGAGPGIGFNLARTGALDAGFRPPQPLGGMAVAEPLPGAAYVAYKLDRWTLLSSVRQGLDATQGAESALLDLGASYGFNLSPRHLITLAGTMTLGHSRAPALPLGFYSSSVLTAQSYRAGEPGMGLRLSWTYMLDRNLFLDTALGYDRLHSGPDWQPGFERATTTFGTTFGYRW